MQNKENKYKQPKLDFFLIGSRTGKQAPTDCRKEVSVILLPMNN
jgi:hypothetical protein